MPNANRSQTAYIHTGNPDTMNASGADYVRLGELGTEFEWNNRVYQIVQVDSGATASPTVGAVAANQLAFWKDKATYKVTNDKRFALLGAVANSFGNNVAGVFRVAATAGYYVAILKKGYNIAAAVATADEGNVTGGTSVIADVTADTASVDGVAVGTATTYQKLGVTRTASSSNVAYVDFDVNDTP